MRRPRLTFVPQVGVLGVELPAFRRGLLLPLGVHDGHGALVHQVRRLELGVGRGEQVGFLGRLKEGLAVGARRHQLGLQGGHDEDLVEVETSTSGTWKKGMGSKTTANTRLDLTLLGNKRQMAQPLFFPALPARLLCSRLVRCCQASILLHTTAIGKAQRNIL